MYVRICIRYVHTHIHAHTHYHSPHLRKPLKQHFQPWPATWGGGRNAPCLGATWSISQKTWLESHVRSDFIYIARLVVVYYCSTYYKVRLSPHWNCRTTLFLETLVKPWPAQRQGQSLSHGISRFAVSEFQFANSDTKTLVWSPRSKGLVLYRKGWPRFEGFFLLVSFCWFLSLVSLVSLVTNLWETLCSENWSKNCFSAIPVWNESY